VHDKELRERLPVSRGLNQIADRLAPEGELGGRSTATWLVRGFTIKWPCRQSASARGGAPVLHRRRWSLA
jgi:hypothetical protein